MTHLYVESSESKNETVLKDVVPSQATLYLNTVGYHIEPEFLALSDYTKITG